MKATGVNPATPLRLWATQAGTERFSLFCPPCTSGTGGGGGGARDHLAGPCPQPLLLSSPTLLLPPCLWMGSELSGFSPEFQTQQEKGVISQLSCPHGRCGAGEGAEGLPALCSARFHAAVTTCPAVVQCVQLSSVA